MPRLSLSAWPAALADPANTLAIDRRWYGHVVRHNEWCCRDYRRDWHVIYLIVDNPHGITIDGQPITTEPGRFIWAPAGRRIDACWPIGTVHAECWFRLDGPDGACDVAGLPVADRAHDLLPIFTRLADEILRSPPRWLERCRYLLAGLLIEVERLGATAPSERRLSFTQCGRLNAYLREDPQAWPSVGDLARCLGLSHDYFARVFRATYGMSPRRWLARQRLVLAARLLSETTLPVAAVASRVGMRSAEAFARRFAAEHGCPPSEYRRRS